MEWLNQLTGIFKHSPYNKSNIHGISNNAVNTILRLKNNLWLGTAFGINIYKPKTIPYIQYEYSTTDGSIIDNRINNILVDKSGNIWVGTRDGVSYLDTINHEFISPVLNQGRHSIEIGVSTVFEDNIGGIWIGMYGQGINLFNHKTKKLSYYLSNANNRGFVFVIYQDQQGSIWPQTAGGINLLDKKTNKFIYYPYDPENENSLVASSVTAIHEDTTGFFWVGIAQYGLAQFDRVSKKYRFFTTVLMMLQALATIGSMRSMKTVMVRYGSVPNLASINLNMKPKHLGGSMKRMD